MLKSEKSNTSNRNYNLSTRIQTTSRQDAPYNHKHTSQTTDKQTQYCAIAQPLVRSAKKVMERIDWLIEHGLMSAQKYNKRTELQKHSKSSSVH